MDSFARNRVFAVVGFAAGAVALSSGVVNDLFVRAHDGTFIADPATIVRLGSHVTAPFRWASFLDLIGSYLLMLPLAVYLRTRFHGEHPVAIDLGTAAATVFVAVGGAGAAMWVSAAPLIDTYAHAPLRDRPHLAAIFAAVIHVGAGLWHYVAGPALAVWLGSVAVATRRELRAFSTYSAIVAAVTAAASIGTMMMPDATSSGPTTLFFLPLAIWPVWLGALIWRATPQ